MILQGLRVTDGPCIGNCGVAFAIEKYLLDNYNIDLLGIGSKTGPDT